jgi:hypothetical protein
MKLNSIILIKVIFIFFLNKQFSQYEYLPNNIKTVILKTTNSTAPFINFDELIELSFDDLESDEKTYYYQINHFDYKWISSNLPKSDYLDGFDDLRIKEYRNSFNTLKSYSHYKLTIPNDDVSLKISGNYSISIHLSSGERIFEKKFSIIKNNVPVQISVSKSNIISNIQTDQKIKVIINCGDCTSLYNSSSKLKIIIIKNNNWTNSQIIEKPKYVLSNKLIYDNIVFKGGNEFLNFDNSNINSTNIKIFKTKLTDLYNNYLRSDKERTKLFYEYNPDINGEYVINSNKSYDMDVENDYARIYFDFQTDIYDHNKKIYLLGKFNNFNVNENYKLEYDDQTKSYKGSFLFKQGFYNYKYGYTSLLNNYELQYFEGDFWKTENTFTVLLYQKKINEKYFKIIGSQSISSKNIKN